MSTQNINPETMPEFEGIKESKVVRILRTPAQSKSDYVDFLWEDADGNREARCMRITLEQSEYLGFGETEEIIKGDEFVGMEWNAYHADCLTKHQLRCIIIDYQNEHEPSDLFVAERVVGKRRDSKICVAVLRMKLCSTYRKTVRKLSFGLLKVYRPLFHRLQKEIEKMLATKKVMVKTKHGLKLLYPFGCKRIVGRRKKTHKYRFSLLKLIWLRLEGCYLKKMRDMRLAFPDSIYTPYYHYLDSKTDKYHNLYRNA